MNPYYQHGGITIYCADNRDVLPTLGPVDLILADPQYGINYVHGAAKIKHASRFNETPVYGDNEPFDPSRLLSFPNVVLWGANHYCGSIPSYKGRWLIWDKRCQVIPARDQADCEMAWCSVDGVDRMFYHFWDGFNKQSERGEQRFHPTQKPIALMVWCLSFFPKAKMVVDPYCGAGSTLIAAKRMGLQATGIEIEERYCEIAARRLSQEVFDFAPGDHPVTP